jgi:NAD(P)-dependent dehydrogenase (short-subunit alcohol dehydrogenase family)
VLLCAAYFYGRDGGLPKRLLGALTYQPVSDPRSALDLSGTVALVTGGVRGIGLGITRIFLAAGADVVVCARHEPESLPTVDGRTAAFFQADVRDPDSAFELVDKAVERFGRLDTVINNAGGGPSRPAATASPSFSSKVIDLNLMSALHVAQRGNAVMQEQESGGSIIMIGSVSGWRPSPGAAAYAASKAGLHHLATTLAVEWAPKVRVNTVIAGLIATEQVSDHYGGEAGIAAVSATIPLGRMGTPDDIAGACLFLASPLSSYVSGSQLLVHGGGEWPAYISAVSTAVSAQPSGGTS